MNLKNFFKKDELKLLWPFYLSNLLPSILLISAAFQIIYFLEFGYSLTQIGFFLGAFGLGTVLFEIPTGAIADMFGRKASVILGTLLSAVAVIAVFFISNFYSLIGLFFVYGAFSTLISGASDAWVVDLLHDNKRKNLVHEFYSKHHSFGNFAMLLSGIVGAFIVQHFGITSIWLVTGFAMVVYAIILSFGKENYTRTKKVSVKKSFVNLFKQSKDSIKYSFKHEIISILLFISLVGAFAYFFSGEMSWFPLLREMGFQEHWFGYVFSASFLVGIFAPLSSRFFVKKFGSYKRLVIFTSFLVLIVLSMIYFVNGWVLGVVLYVLFMSIDDFHVPVSNVFFQNFVPNKKRATIASFQNFVVSLAGVIAMPLVGFVVDSLGPKTGIFIGGLLMIPVMLLYLRIKEPKSLLKRLNT